MSPTEFVEALKPYTDADGLVSPYLLPPTARNGSGNGLVYTSLAYIFLALRDRWYLMADFAKMVVSCEVEPGLLRRGPVHPDHEGPDDYLAVVAAAAVLSRGPASTSGMTAWWILEYGRRHFYLYNNVQPGRWRLRSWFGRFPALIAHMEWGAMTVGGGEPPAWRRWWWALALWYSARSPARAQDHWVQSWLMILCQEERGRRRWYLEWAKRRWWLAFTRLFPGGLRQVLAEYFGTHDHPLVRYAPGIGGWGPAPASSHENK